MQTLLFIRDSLGDISDKLYKKILWCLSFSCSVLRYMLKFKKPLHLKKPKDLNEKVIWLSFFSDTSSWPYLADKVRVRDYLKKLGLDNLSVPILNKWQSANEIDFSTLPNKFVIKTNHGCGDVELVNDKTQIDEASIKHKMSYYLKRRFGLWTGEPHYLSIEPCIFAERLLINDCSFSSSVVDYKFYCFYGEPKCVLVCFDRDKLHAQKIVYDLNWKRRDDLTHMTKHTVMKDIPQPQGFEIMKEACAILGKPFPFVRIDFYESEGNVYFGEMTFTPAAGRSTAVSQKALDWLGNFIQIV